MKNKHENDEMSLKEYSDKYIMPAVEKLFKQYFEPLIEFYDEIAEETNKEWLSE